MAGMAGWVRLGIGNGYAVSAYDCVRRIPERA